MRYWRLKMSIDTMEEIVCVWRRKYEGRKLYHIASKDGEDNSLQNNYEKIYTGSLVSTQDVIEDDVEKEWKKAQYESWRRSDVVSWIQINKSLMGVCMNRKQIEKLLNKLLIIDEVDGGERKYTLRQLRGAWAAGRFRV